MTPVPDPVFVADAAASVAQGFSCYPARLGARTIPPAATDDQASANTQGLTANRFVRGDAFPA